MKFYLSLLSDIGAVVCYNAAVCNASV